MKILRPADLKLTPIIAGSQAQTQLTNVLDTQTLYSLIHSYGRDINFIHVPLTVAEDSILTSFDANNLYTQYNSKFRSRSIHALGREA